jgi:hypothetical protein
MKAILKLKEELVQAKERSSVVGRKVFQQWEENVDS